MVAERLQCIPYNCNVPGLTLPGDFCCMSCPSLPPLFPGCFSTVSCQLKGERLLWLDRSACTHSITLTTPKHKKILYIPSSDLDPFALWSRLWETIVSKYTDKTKWNIFVFTFMFWHHLKFKRFKDRLTKHHSDTKDIVRQTQQLIYTQAWINQFTAKTVCTFEKKKL